MSSSYPVPSCAVPVSAGIGADGRGAAGAAGVAAEERQRTWAEEDRSALVIGGTEKIRAGGDLVVFCKVVAVAEAQVKRDGQVRAKGSPVHHATLGPLEEWLDAKAGPGVIGGIAGRAPLDARFVKGERERLLARAFMIRVIVLMTLMPEAADPGRDRSRWPGTWRWSRGRGRGGRRRTGRPGTGGARSARCPWKSCGTSCSARPGGSTRARAGPVAVTMGRTRPLKAGSLDGTLIRVPDTPANQGVLRHRGHR